MELCSICKKNPAVMFITKIVGGKRVREGLCIECLRERNTDTNLKLSLQQMGVSDEDIEKMKDQVDEFLESMGDINQENINEALEMINGEEEDMGGAATAPLSRFFNNILGICNSIEEKNSAPKEENDPIKNRRHDRRGRQKQSMLDIYGTNLTAKAALGQVDRVVNRDKEIDRVMQILNRRQKNNPVLLGEPGVGKTAVAEGLACRIFEKKVPPKLMNAQLYLLDFTAIVAGTQFRGQFEARLKSILNEAAAMKNTILVIDEIHNIVAAGDATGAMSAANILKPALARGEIQVIGATTLNEYRKNIEKDSALERRFQPVLIDEPSIEESIEILEGIKDYYQDYHHVRISKSIVEEAVRLSERYITDRFLPDKAIDVIDEAGARVNLRNTALYELEKLKERAANLDGEIEKAEKDMDYEKAAGLKTEKFTIGSRIAAAQLEADKAEITYDDIAAVIESWTKIPVHRLTEEESETLLTLEDKLHERVVGQDDAVKSVSSAIRRGRADITKRKRPVSFIFAGPTGVGKTELVKTIAYTMFGSEEALIRIDMSEYMESHSVSKLIGSPPGYVGYDDAGQLTEKVRRRPYSVILLDEIEKAHPDVFNLFLQILDDGRVADSHGKIINFENTIIIMTTNAGSDIKRGLSGFMASEEIRVEDNVERSLKSFFRPEFLNRIDEVIVFKSLKKEELRKIIDLMLKDIKEKLEEKGAKLVVTDAAKEIILAEGYNTQYGARPLRRAIVRKLEDKLAQLSLRGGIEKDSIITADKGKDGDIELVVITRKI